MRESLLRLVQVFLLPFLSLTQEARGHQRNKLAACGGANGHQLHKLLVCGVLTQ